MISTQVAVPGAARQRGRAILARLALKLRAVSGLRDVALDLPGEPAPAPAAGAALADFRRRVAAAAAQAAPSQADVDAEARRKAAKRERNRRIREEKERRARETRCHPPRHRRSFPGLDPAQARRPRRRPSGQRPPRPRRRPPKKTPKT